jgi:ATP-dependent RNA helicase DDX41
VREASQVQTNALQAAKEVAMGQVYASWTLPLFIAIQQQEAWNKIRNEWHMQVQGYDVPPPIRSFVDMKFPTP